MICDDIHIFAQKLSILAREQNEKKRRKLKSKVWSEFTKSKLGEDGKQWAICNHCGGKFDASSKKGTTHLKNHLESMICRAKRNRSIETRDLLTPVVRKEKSSVIDLIKHSFDARGYPTEHWDPWVLNSRKVEILKVYKEEKEKLGEFLDKLSCRFSLEIVQVYDRWLLIVHYIDDTWEHQNKIISTLQSGVNLEEMKDSCLAWKIDKSICSVLLDCCFMEDHKEVIETWFNERSSLPFAGIVPDFRGFINTIEILTCNWEMIKIDGLRQCVDYGYKTPSNKLKLQCGVNNAINMGKNVIFYDAPPRRNYDGPFEYLEIAVGLKEAFFELQKIDSDFISINLIKEKWNEATATFEHLKVLKEFSYSFRSKKHTTTEVVDILKLLRCCRSEDCHVCKNGTYEKFVGTYWNNCYLVVSILIILDPRFKMDTIQRWYEEIYGSDADGYLEKIFKDFRKVYNEYAKDSSDYKIVDTMGRPSTSSTKSELNLYLHDLKVPAVEEFDILTWWRGNAPFYPTLARMARDYLAIPISHSPTIDFTWKLDMAYIRNSEVDYEIFSNLRYLRGWL